MRVDSCELTDARPAIGRKLVSGVADTLKAAPHIDTLVVADSGLVAFVYVCNSARVVCDLGGGGKITRGLSWWGEGNPRRVHVYPRA